MKGANRLLARSPPGQRKDSEKCTNYENGSKTNKHKINPKKIKISHLIVLTWFEVVEVLAVSVFGPVSYSPSNELWDDAEAVPVLDSRFNWIYAIISKKWFWIMMAHAWSVIGSDDNF